jgi:hypothetical protein
MTDDLERQWKEMALMHVKALSQSLLGGIKENLE